MASSVAMGWTELSSRDDLKRSDMITNHPRFKGNYVIGQIRPEKKADISC